jgi:hypothetical protein
MTSGDASQIEVQCIDVGKVLICHPAASGMTDEQKVTFADTLCKWLDPVECGIVGLLALPMDNLRAGEGDMTAQDDSWVCSVGGTSLATAAVSGLLATVMSKHPFFPQSLVGGDVWAALATIRSLLQAACVDIWIGYSATGEAAVPKAEEPLDASGAGIINAMVLDKVVP